MERYAPEKIRNVAIVGHGAAGKTMLTEHLLYTAGATERLGTIEGGTTQSDWDPLEARRRISTGASVLPLEWHGCKINLVDVPGTPDLVAEMHCVARAVEAMIIVCEAKADLDLGFELAWEVAETYGLARAIFVNKLERDNADYEGLMNELDRRYGHRIVGVQIPIGSGAAFSGVLDVLGMKVYRGKDRGVEIEEIPNAYALDAMTRREKMMDAAAEGDDDLAMKYLDGAELTEDEIEHGMLVGIERGKVVPVMVGSAASGLGVATLLDRICMEFPSPAEAPKDREGRSVFLGGEAVAVGSPDGHPVAFCFKTVTDPYVGKLSFLRVMEGTLRADARLKDVRSGVEERLHHLFFPHGKGHEDVTEVGPGDLCAVAKLSGVKTGDTLADPAHPVDLPPIALPEPTYRMAIETPTKVDEDRLPAAIERLLEEDPSLRYVRDEATGETVLEGMGPIHLELVVERLKSRSGVTVHSHPASIPYRETITRRAKAQGRHKRQTGGKGQFGDCWIEIEPLPRGEGFVFENRVVGGAIPKGFIPAIEKGVRDAMAHGHLAGHPIVDLKVTVTDGSYHDVDSNEMAFRTAGSLALKAALETAGVVVLEPHSRLRVETPDESVGDVVGDLNGRRGMVQGMEQLGESRTVVHATVPSVNLASYASELRALTKGRGRFGQTHEGYLEAPATNARVL